VQLPDIEGFEVCRRIKANPATASIPVLHLSASFVKSEHKVQGLEGGANGYLAQPVEPIELLATVNALLRIRQAEESALALAREWQTTFDAIGDGVCLLNSEGRVLRCNSAMTNFLRKPLSEIKGQFYQELMQTMLGSIEVTPFTRVQELHHRESMELQFGERWFSVTTDPVFDEQRTFTGAVYILSDITDHKGANRKLKTEIIERKRTEKKLRRSEERLRLALKVAPTGTWDWNILTNQVTWSHNYELLFGLTPGTFGDTYECVLEYIHPQDRKLLVQAVRCCLDQKVCYDHEYRVVWPDGSIRWMAGKGEVFYDETGTQAVRMIGITTDITQRKQTAKQLKESLYEKEVLLKEIHHRVKNNMQVICSLLNLQSASISDPQTLEILQEGQNRVASMALVHEQLYQSEDLARIDFAEYVENLAANLLSSYHVNSDRIALKINVEHIHLSVDVAIPCGLIINEIVTNSLKYAFPLGKSGEICIEFHSDNNNQLLLSLSDNGIGLPPDFDIQNTETLGLKLVTALTGQLSGTIVLNRNVGTEFKITFTEKSL
jgi:PAS domain S-box-containing protein